MYAGCLGFKFLESLSSAQKGNLWVDVGPKTKLCLLCQLILTGFRRRSGHATAHVGSLRASACRHLCCYVMLGACKCALRMAERMLVALGISAWRETSYA